MVHCNMSIVMLYIHAMRRHEGHMEQTTSEPKSTKPRYANALNKELAAAINGLYRFKSETHALGKLAALKAQFTTAAQEVEDPKSLTLWIRNYEVSPEEEQVGFQGHYGVVQCTRMDDEDGYYTLTVTKEPRELKNHPIRKRPAARCPNWGHPILRSILKEKTYTDMFEASQALEALHLEYPETTIPADNMHKLYLMIFSRRENPKQPLEKYVLEVKNLQGGGFTIEAKKNTFKPSATAKKTAPTSTAEPAEPMGHFSSMVALKRNKKRKPTDS